MNACIAARQANRSVHRKDFPSKPGPATPCSSASASMTRVVTRCGNTSLLLELGSCGARPVCGLQPRLWDADASDAMQETVVSVARTCQPIRHYVIACHESMVAGFRLAGCREASDTQTISSLSLVCSEVAFQSQAPPCQRLPFAQFLSLTCTHAVVHRGLSAGKGMPAVKQTSLSKSHETTRFR